MAAGLGFKTFTTGEVLTAADTNGYLMQGVLVFASSAARAAAISSPQEGQYSYLKDTNSTEYYDGAAWIAAPIGDITGVTAGTGISGGGTSGTVTITNSMATEITAKGDLIAGTGSATFDNLAVGTNGQTLVADSSTSTGLKWATPASGGGMTLLSTTSLSGISTTVSSISQSYTNLVCWIQGFDYSTTAIARININGSAGAARISGVRDSTVMQILNFDTSGSVTGGYSGASIVLAINNYTSASYEKAVQFYGRVGSASTINNFTGTIDSLGAITSITVTTAAGTASYNSGTIKIYGVN